MDWTISWVPEESWFDAFLGYQPVFFRDASRTA
jgi:hypothetical protein